LMTLLNLASNLDILYIQTKVKPNLWVGSYGFNKNYTTS
jgi:hypothetical protein